MRTTAQRAILVLALMAPLAACHTPDPNSGAKTYPARGVIEHISDDQHTATIQNEAIPGYMAAMTMDFSVRDAHLLDGLSRGDQINFTLEVTPDDSWITNVQRTGHIDLADTGDAATNAAPTLNPGDLLPNSEFIAEDGRHIRFSEFRGKAVAFTFFFTRCPLPNYCPLMNRNFAAARDLLRAMPHAPQNWELLSVSFDSDFDTPQMLAAYAVAFRNHDSDRWLFAAATPDALTHFAAPLGLMIMRSGNGISHNLRTVIADPNGRIFRQFDDNLWNPEQLADTVRDAAEVPIATGGTDSVRP